MWSLWHKSKSLNCRPSRLLEVEDSLAAYCFDSAVVTLGTIIENALLERDEVGEGSGKSSVPRYTLEQLLDPAFVLPRSTDDGRGGEDVDWARVDGMVYDEVG